MRGLFQVADRQIEIQELPTPEPQGNEVRVRTVLSGLCGTNVHQYRGFPFRVSPEVIQGHEAVGFVDAVGPWVSHTKVGDRVMAYQAFGCGYCEACIRGEDHACMVNRAHCLGQTRHGAQADTLVITERMALPIPNHLTFEDAVVLSCAGGTAYSALRKAHTTYDDAIAIFGLGPVGLMAVLFGKAMGAKVIGVDPVHERLALASTVGADAVIDAGEDDPVARIRDLTGGAGATVGVEASGNTMVRTKTIYEATSPRRRTRIVYLALGDPADRMPLIFGARTVTRSHIFSIPEYHEMCRLIAEKGLHPGSIITHRFSLDQATEAYELLETGHLGKAVFDLT